MALEHYSRRTLLSWKPIAIGVLGLVLGIGSGALAYRMAVEWVMYGEELPTPPFFSIPKYLSSLPLLQGETEPTTPAKPEATIRLLFVGDVMLDRDVRSRITTSRDPFYPFLSLKNPDGTYFHGQDVVIANLEGPVTPTRRAPEKEIDFAFDPSTVATLKKVGITAVSQANNHTLDQGRLGADESRALLTDGGLVVFGDQVRDNATSSLAFLTVKDRKVALIGWNITDNPLDPKEAAQVIAQARTQASRVLVFMHWGAEYTAKPNGTQTSNAHHFIDSGADAVIGAHPHWMQSVEMYKNKPILYSLGNFIFDQEWSEETTYGLTAKLTFNGTTSSVALYPVAIDRSKPRFLEGEERAQRLQHLADISDPVLADAIRSGTLTFK